VSSIWENCCEFGEILIKFGQRPLALGTALVCLEGTQLEGVGVAWLRSWCGWAW